MKRLTTILFFILLAELALGGGGRLTALGPISLRMILFGLALILSAFQFPLEKKLPRDYFILLILFSALTLMSLIRGIALGATRVYWWEDVKPLLYFLILPFFYYAVADYKTIGNIASLLKLNGVFQSVIFFLLLALIHSGALPFLTFYHSIKDTEEFFFVAK